MAFANELYFSQDKLKLLYQVILERRHAWS
jgi:hypothetical protein